MELDNLVKEYKAIKEQIHSETKKFDIELETHKAKIRNIQQLLHIIEDNKKRRIDELEIELYNKFIKIVELINKKKEN